MIKQEDEENNSELESFLFRVKNNLDEFKLYLIKVLSQQLDNLFSTKATVYDIESYDQKSLLKYLLVLWK